MGAGFTATRAGISWTIYAMKERCILRSSGLKELAEGRGKRSASAAALFKDLGIQGADAGKIWPVQTRRETGRKARQGHG
jgi:hypothetical protein